MERILVRHIIIQTHVDRGEKGIRRDEAPRMKASWRIPERTQQSDEEIGRFAPPYKTKLREEAMCRHYATHVVELVLFNPVTGRPGEGLVVAPGRR
jgi:hypothetical protein